MSATESEMRSLLTTEQRYAIQQSRLFHRLVMENAPAPSTPPVPVPVVPEDGRNLVVVRGRNGRDSWWEQNSSDPSVMRLLPSRAASLVHSALAGVDFNTEFATLGDERNEAVGEPLGEPPEPPEPPSIVLESLTPQQRYVIEHMVDNPRAPLPEALFPDALAGDLASSDAESVDEQVEIAEEQTATDGTSPLMGRFARAARVPHRVEAGRSNRVAPTPNSFFTRRRVMGSNDAGAPTIYDAAESAFDYWQGVGRGLGHRPPRQRPRERPLPPQRNGPYWFVRAPHGCSPEHESVCKFLDEHADTPDQFKCPISLFAMRDPVVMTDGHLYERHSLEKLRVAGNREKIHSPITREVLIGNPRPVVAIHQLMEMWALNNGYSHNKQETEQDTKAAETAEKATETELVV